MSFDKIFMLIVFTLLYGCAENSSNQNDIDKNKEENLKIQMEEETTNQTLLDGKLRLYVPDEFLEVSQSELVEQFPNERQRPTVVFRESEQVKLSINYGSSPATNNDLTQIKQAFQNTYNRPEIDFRESKVEAINGSNLVLMSFVLPKNAKSLQIVNTLFIGSVSGQLLLGSFSYPLSQANKWEPVGKEIIQSIKI